MLDISLFRVKEGGNPDLVRESQRRRFKDVEVVDKVIACDDTWREARHKADLLNRMNNLVSKTVGEKKKAKEADGTESSVPLEVKEALTELTADLLRPLCVTQLKEVKKLLEVAVAANNASLQESEASRDRLLKSIGNLVHDSVVVSKDEANNGIERTVGEKMSKKYSHVDLVHMIKGVDSKRGTVTAGGRGYYLLGPLVALERAVVELGLDLLRGGGFTEVVPPLFVRRDVMTEVAQLEQFDEELYKVSGKSEGALPEDDKYLIATSEQPIAAFHRDEWLAKDTLPLKYAGLSYCFRQEVGSHGRDTRGIFRVHQFQKVEQFMLTSPHDGASWEALDHMIGNAEALCQALGLSYQVVNIVSGELNNAAAKKLDLEAWFPASGAYRELVSCSNCTDYQARRLRVRHGATKAMNAQVEYVHMLNGTMAATTRVMCALLETHQTEFRQTEDGIEGGIIVPEAIRKYMPEKYRELIPFVQSAPIDEEEGKKQKKKGKAAPKN